MITNTDHCLSVFGRGVTMLVSSFCLGRCLWQINSIWFVRYWSCPKAGKPLVQLNVVLPQNEVHCRDRNCILLLSHHILKSKIIIGIPYFKTSWHFQKAKYSYVVHNLSGRSCYLHLGPSVFPEKHLYCCLKLARGVGKIIKSNLGWLGHSKIDELASNPLFFPFPLLLENK